VRDLLDPLYVFNVVDSLKSRGKPAVDREDFAVDNSSDGQEVKHIGEVLPHPRVPVLRLALGVEPVNLGDLPSFVVAPQQADAPGKP